MNKPICNCKDCQEERERTEKHLKHPFYQRAHDYREQERNHQILKGAAKYPEPFNPNSWTAKELLAHAMQENVDQGHYIYGLYEKIEALEVQLWAERRNFALLEQAVNGSDKSAKIFMSYYDAKKAEGLSE